jgi:hypothetical protein
MAAPITKRIRFIAEAREQRVTEGNPSANNPAERVDRTYEVIHRVGEEMDVTAASAKHWVSRGKAQIIGDATGQPNAFAVPGTLPPAPAAPFQPQHADTGVPLPPPPQ